MTPAEQITALMSTVNNEMPDTVVACKKNNTHTLKLLLRWADDLSPVPTASFKLYRGNAVFKDDQVAKGKYDAGKVPIGNYLVFFPDIHKDEITEE